MFKPLKPWSEGWIEAIEREKDRLESMRATDLYTTYGETDAMLIDEIVCDVTFERHLGPWIDDDHESECWEPLFTETATLTLWDLKKHVDRNTRNLIDVWLMDRAEKNVAQRERDRQIEYAEMVADIGRVFDRRAA